MQCVQILCDIAWEITFSVLLIWLHLRTSHELFSLLGVFQRNTVLNDYADELGITVELVSRNISYCIWLWVFWYIVKFMDDIQSVCIYWILFTAFFAMICEILWRNVTDKLFYFRHRSYCFAGACQKDMWLWPATTSPSTDPSYWYPCQITLVSENIHCGCYLWCCENTHG